MKKLFLFFFLCIAANAQAQDIVKKMYSRYAKDFRKSLSFVQQTAFYQNDTILRKAVWYEALVYPDKLRIDINSPDSGNVIFFVNDSAYRYQNNKLKGKSYQPHDLLFVLGGMYSFPLDTVYEKLKRFGYDTQKTFETTWKGKKVIVVGADKEKAGGNQFWVDKEKLVTVRILNNKKKKKSEKYTKLKENVKINPDFLDPDKLGEVKFWKQ